MAKEKKIKFEEALERLERIVSQLEDEKLSLEKAIALYEEGVKLIALCTRCLDEAEKRIEILSRNVNGSLRAEPFPEGGEGEDAPENEGEGRLLL